MKYLTRYTIGWNPGVIPAVHKFRIKSDDWKYKTILDVRVWCNEAALNAALVTKLCTHEVKGWAEYREKEILDLMLQYQSTQDEDFQFTFAYWWKANGFEARYQELGNRWR